MNKLSTEVIGLKGVSKTYKIGSQEVQALNNIDLSIAKGQAVAVIGRSGSGKSTLLHVIGTIDSPTSGEVLIDGTSIKAMPDRELSGFRNMKVGFVFQANNLLPEFSALENVMMPGLIGGKSWSSMERRALELLKAVGLAERLNHRPGELSGGEQQRVAIARALVMAPQILLADEPTGNLDKSTSEAVQQLLLDLCLSHGVTMLLVTHDLALADRFPSRIVMEDGVIFKQEGQW